MNWKQIRTQADADALMELFVTFMMGVFGKPTSGPIIG